jgi:hypothetical protein
MMHEVFPSTRLTPGVWEIGRRLAFSQRPCDRDHRRDHNATAFWWGRDTVVELRGAELRCWIRRGDDWRLDTTWAPEVQNPHAMRPVSAGLAVLDASGALVVLDRTGRRAQTITLPSADWRAVAPWRDGYLLASPTDCLIVEIDAQGRPGSQWDRSDGLKEPWGIDPRPDGAAFLVADARRHQILEVYPGGPIGVVFGIADRAGARPDRLDAPVFARYVEGTVVIADTKNDRLLRIAGARAAPLAESFAFWHPRSVDVRPSGELLVAEGRGGRVVVMSQDDSVGTCVIDGDRDVPAFVIRQPRGAHFFGPGRVLVADCRNDRCLEIDTKGRILRVIDPGGDLDWPRHVAGTASGFVISDGRNRRLVFTDLDGTRVGEWRAWRTAAGEEVPFGDPHHVALAHDYSGRELLLVTDSEAGMVVALDSDAVAHSTWRGLNDPHMAEWHAGGVLVCETGADRIVRLDPAGGVLSTIDADDVGGATGTPLVRPRGFASVVGLGTLIVDTGNDRLLIKTADGSIRDLTAQLRCAAGSLYFPRFVAVDHEARLVIVSDFDNHRLVVADLAGLLESR